MISPALLSGIRKESMRICPSPLSARQRLPLGNALQIAVEDSVAEVRPKRARCPCSARSTGAGTCCS